MKVDEIYTIPSYDYQGENNWGDVLLPVDLKSMGKPIPLPDGLEARVRSDYVSIYKPIKEDGEDVDQGGDSDDEESEDETKDEKKDNLLDRAEAARACRARPRLWCLGSLECSARISAWGNWFVRAVAGDG